MRLFNSNGLIYRCNNHVWEVWSATGCWITSIDANDLGSELRLRFLQDLKLIGNNFKLK